jgi:hypothetical protein
MARVLTAPAIRRGMDKPLLTWCLRMSEACAGRDDIQRLQDRRRSGGKTDTDASARNELGERGFRIGVRNRTEDDHNKPQDEEILGVDEGRQAADEVAELPRNESSAAAADVATAIMPISSMAEGAYLRAVARTRGLIARCMSRMTPLVKRRV